jgi:NADH-quinone oxidoreductase subunit M
VFPFHTWQPLAYVQAPLGVTILLAALLAKTAIYGLMRFSVPFFPIIIYEWSPYLMGLAAVSVAFGAMVALVQKQMKSLIAYASLSHMGMIALGVFAMTSQSWQGSVIQMISHGVTITGLFLMIGFLFNRKPANDIDLFGGLWKLMPLFGAMFMILSLSMIGLPGTNGFIGEFLILIGTFNSSFATSAIWTIVAMTSVILGAVYMLRMFQRMMMGPLNNPEPERMPDLTKREIGLLIPLILFIFWIGLYPKTFTAKTEKTVQSVMIRTHKLIEEHKIKNKVKQIKQPQKSLF